MPQPLTAMAAATIAAGSANLDLIADCIAYKSNGVRRGSSPGWFGFVASPVPKCEESSPHGRRPVRGDPVSVFSLSSFFYETAG